METCWNPPLNILISTFCICADVVQGLTKGLRHRVWVQSILQATRWHIHSCTSFPAPPDTLATSGQGLSLPPYPVIW
jgi:hypothetical protein